MIKGNIPCASERLVPDRNPSQGLISHTKHVHNSGHFYRDRAREVGQSSGKESGHAGASTVDKMSG